MPVVEASSEHALVSAEPLHESREPRNPSQIGSTQHAFTLFWQWFAMHIPHADVRSPLNRQDVAVPAGGSSFCTKMHPDSAAARRTT